MTDNKTKEDKSFGSAGDEPHAYIQWKSTDVCMEFECECGEGYHYDGFFAYTVKCPSCGVTWEMPCNLFPRKVCDQTPKYWVENPILLREEG